MQKLKIEKMEPRVDRDQEQQLARKRSEIRGWTAKRAFRSWLGRQHMRADAVGSLARHAATDGAFPANPGLVITHLSTHLAESSALAAARLALREYASWLESEVERDARDACDRGGEEAAEAVRERTAESLDIVRELLTQEVEG
jgi:hypothetical protein